MKPSYLITGGAGFIGSHLTDAFVERGERVVILDDLSTGRLQNLEGLLASPLVRFHEGSILDETLVRRLVSDCDVVIHLAASVGVELIVQEPLASLINNIRGTEIVIGVCADLERRVLVASTSEIYGKNANGPVREDADRILGSPFVSRWAYSTSKAVDEILAHAYWRERGTPSTVVRLFNCVGPRQSGAYGMVVPRFVRQALRGEDLTVFGDGEQRRCFCHVLDTVAALVSLLEHEESIGDVFNVGASWEISINDLARKVVDLSRSSSRVVHIPYDVAYERGFEDMLRRVPDVSKLHALTGWEPRFTLDDTLLDVIAFENSAREPAAGDDGR